MATYQELNKIYQETFQRELPRATLSRWVKKGEIKINKNVSNKYDYDLESFIEKINSESTQKMVRATKEKPEDYIGKTHEQLLITGIVPKEEYESNYHGTLMYCDCLRCGKKHFQVRFSYLTPNGNYSQQTCGCGRKTRAFMASSRTDLSQEFLDSFDDFDKFAFIHKSLTRTTKIDILNIPFEEYKKLIGYFYNDNQFNKVYSFWKQHENQNETFYDWAKPSIDHIIPSSKGGTDDITNLQFLTVFENLSKRDMSMEEWNNFKKITNTTSDYFIENIL